MKELSQRVISSAEIDRAMYLDFEGLADSPPSLAGVWCQDAFYQTVFDDALEPAAVAKGLTVSYIDDFLGSLLKTCLTEGRRLVAFSQHEKRVAALYADVDFSPVYCDGRMIAKRWVNRAGLGPDIEQWDLQGFLNVVAFEVPLHLGTRQSAKRLRDVRAMLVRRGEYQKLTPTVKAKWTKLLHHNQLDCVGLHHLMRHTA